MKIKPKYIRVASDLHLEGHLGQREAFLAECHVPPDPRDAESILILAGDISSKPQQLLYFLAALKDQFLKVIYVPGNHEFYGHDILKLEKDLKFSLTAHDMDDKISYSGNGVVVDEFDGVRIIHTTLWGDGGATIQEEGDIGNCLRDFYVVMKDGKRFTVADMRALHEVQKSAIAEALKQPFDGKTVVATHHLPSYSLCHPRFGDAINGGFASHCDNLFDENAPDVWIHGHTHDTHDKMMHNTRIVCNPLGYVREWGGQFNSFGAKFLEVETINELEAIKPAISE